MRQSVSPILVFRNSDRNTDVLWWQDHVTEITQPWIRNLDKIFNSSEL